MSNTILPPWLHCNRCTAFANSSSSSSSSSNSMYILECTHVLCSRCLVTLDPTVDCPVCATRCAFRPIDQHMPPETHAFFSDHALLAEIDRLRYCIQFQISNQNAALAYMREKIAHQNALLRDARDYIGHPSLASPMLPRAANRPRQTPSVAASSRQMYHRQHPTMDRHTPAQPSPWSLYRRGSQSTAGRHSFYHK